MKHLIIGCGSAGLTALEKIRSIKEEDEITLVTMEDCLPYSPTSLPYLLAGRVKEENIWIKDEAYFRDMKAVLATKKEVVKIIPDKKQVVYRDGESEQYDNLLITTGSDSVKPKIKGLDEVGFLGFHTLCDYHKLVRLLTNKAEVIILGAGLVGMELADAICEKGHKVQVIEKEGEILPLYFDQPAGNYIKDIFSSHGVNIFIGKEVIEMRKSKNKAELSCADGSAFSSDIVITCVGVTSRLSLVEGSGIKINRGILVDSSMRTNIDNIYAAGDVAEAIDFFSEQQGINAIIPNAVDQGKIAGANMAGQQEVSYKGWISMNVFNFFGNMASSVGLSIPHNSDEVLEKKEDKRRYFKRLVFRNSNLIGAMFLNEEVDPGVIRYLIEHTVPIGEHKELLFEKTKEVSRWLMLKTEEAASHAGL